MIKLFATILFLSLSSAILGQTRIQLIRENGVFLVPCKVNGLDLKFVFDTGASDVSISLTEAMFMVKNGYLTPSDILDKQRYQDATGRINVGTRIVLRRIEFAGIVLRDVSASVVNEMNAPLLLGQSAMEQIGRFTLDPKRGVLILEEGSSSPGEQGVQNTPFNYSSIPTYSGMVEVFTLSPILDKPDMAAGKTIGACINNRALIVKKVNDRFYLVESSGEKGYLFVTWIKRQL